MSEQASKTQMWGRYELITLLGTGGMGDVYKAYDPSLNRYVALKILRHEDPEVVKRFLREARAQAKVDHVHVCKVYESGEWNGRPYIAMQFIEGKTLNELYNTLTVEEKVRVIKDVALGLHAAHRQGLIHRDIKPTNIMVVQTEDGELQPYIMDFGIAREQEAAELTSTGVLIGTPLYMSPEHAVGKIEGLDRRSDIYSLGVTIYELLSGKVPFQGNTPVEILMKVIEKDPPALRKVNPRIPVDIETVVMKCLEKDPNRRYSSAKDLADDLQHYMDGDPINARPATITYRIKRKLIKYKVPAAVVGVAVLVIIVLLVLWLSSRWQAYKRAEIAQELGREVEKIESTIRYAHLFRLHDISKEKNAIKLRIRRIGDKMKEVGELGVGPGNYAVGRGYVALQEYSDARKYLERAWNSGFQTAEVAYQLGWVLGELYLHEGEKANRIENKGQREARKKEIKKLFQVPAVKFLRQGAGVQVEEKEYIEAMIAFYEEKYNNALDTLQEGIKKAGEDAAWFYDAKLLEGKIYSAIGREKTEYNQAMNILSQAEKVYEGVIRIGESDIRGYNGLCGVLERKIMLETNSKGGDLQPLVDKTIDLCKKALLIDPAAVNPYVIQASVLRWLGRFEMIQGQEPISTFDQALKSAEQVIALQKDNFEAFTIIGIVNRYKAEYQLSHGQDPMPTLQLGADSFRKAIEINPTDGTAYSGIANVYIRKAEYEMNQGKDPTLSLDEAVANIEKALSINPDLSDLYNGLAGVLWIRGGALMQKGQDAGPSFLKAAQALENAIRLNPIFVHYFSNAGFVYTDLGRYQLNTGADPMNSLQKAVEYFEKAIKINPKANELYMGLVSLTNIRVEYDYLMGKDCSPQIVQASIYLKQGMETNPNDPLLYIRMASNYIIQGSYDVDHRFSPLRILVEADTLMRKAESINPKYYEISVKDAEILILKARWALLNQQNPGQFFKKALEALKKAEGFNPGDTHLHLTRARLYWKQAEWKLNRGMARAGDIEEGIKSAQKVLSINPNHGEAFVLQGVLTLLRARGAADRNARLADQKEGKALVSKGIEKNKNLEKLYK